MSKSIKVKGFFKDINGASTIIKLRREDTDNGSPIADPKDFVRELADQLHPDAMKVRVVSIKDASPTSKTFRFESVNHHIPVFQSGQYVNFRLHIGNSVLTRPYSLASAPYEARGENSFFEITIRRNRSYLVPDYFFNEVKVGDVLDADLPFGSFYWEPLRDSKNILALAGGSGITPFVSMAREIANGKMKGCKLTILFGSVKENDIVCKEALDEAERSCPDIKVVHVLSDEPDWPGEKGFISKEIIAKYSQPDTTYMFCGPLPMYNFVKKALQELNVDPKRFRHDVISNPADVTQLPGYPKGTEDQTFHITVVRGIQQDVIEAKASESVAVALERAAIGIDTHCRAGECGFCRSQLLHGNIFVSPNSDGRREMDKEMNWFHPCASWPLSDLTIKIAIM